ncbi:ATP-binding protein [Kitasatospora sp. NPDC002040]|uniref:sensor histidine kinase n=1 Tax=Kitasatospora sp. NPDC002040 TaxID=3154661 RepID=UPI00331D9D07
MRLGGLLMPLAAGGAAVAWSRHRSRQRVERSRREHERAELHREQGRIEERVRMARDLHDTVAQGLAAVTMLTGAVDRALPAGAPGLAKARERLSTLHRIAVQALGQVGDLTGGVAASQLDGGGLGEAVEQYLGLARRALAGVGDLPAVGAFGGEPCVPAVPELELLRSGAERRLPLTVESAVLRMVQEGVANAVRHSGGRVVRVELHYLSDRLRAEVRDDGRGIPAGREPGIGLGLAGAAQRIRGLGGELSVKSVPGGGAAVAVEFEYPV